MILSDPCTGDALLCTGDTPWAAAIREATHSPYSHVAAIIALPGLPVLVAESIETVGVRATALERWAHGGQIVHARPLGPIDAEGATRWAFAQLGESYNWPEIGAISVHLLTGADERVPCGEKICSEYVRGLWRAGGYEFSLTSPYCVPGDIAAHSSPVR